MLGLFLVVIFLINIKNRDKDNAGKAFELCCIMYLCESIRKGIKKNYDRVYDDTGRYLDEKFREVNPLDIAISQEKKQKYPFSFILFCLCNSVNLFYQRKTESHKTLSVVYIFAIIYFIVNCFIIHKLYTMYNIVYEDYQGHAKDLLKAQQEQRNK